MFTSDYVFAPQSQTLEAKELVLDAAQGLLGSLVKNGQVCGEPITTWIDGKLYATCYVPRPDSLAIEHLSEYGKRAYDTLLALLAEVPRYQVLDDGPFPQECAEWRIAQTVYLFTHFIDISSPVCSGNNGEAIPLYTLPLTAQQREHLVFWQHEYKAVDQLWIDSGELEMTAYRQLADPGSGLARRGRQLCADIETATQKPTYYYLMRYWGRREGEAQRYCPGCGKPWAVRSAHKRFFDFAFRCKSCRLVSHLADSFEDERHARIGEFPRRSTKPNE
jgi:predicted  nucleic acid-binding Zn ribbon protein